jgi:dihydrolipoamide dehydrogenase
MADNFDVVVIGGGPGGYNCAIRLGQLGLAVACIDKRGSFGGTCLNIGCIPSKALLHASDLYELARHDFSRFGITGTPGIDLPAMMEHKDKVVSELTKGVEFLFKKNKVEGIVGEAKIAAPGKIIVQTKTGTREISAKHIVIATGSDVAPLPGITIDEKRIVSSTGALSLNPVPKRLLVVGAGVIGLELGSVWRRLGSEVLVIEFLDRIVPGVDGEVAKQFQRLLERQGMKFKLSSKVVGIETTGASLSVAVEPAKGGSRENFSADIVLVAIGRRPYTDGLGLDEAGVKRDSRGRVVTEIISAPACPASGPLAMCGRRDAGAQSRRRSGRLPERIAGRAGHVNYDAIPSVISLSK